LQNLVYNRINIVSDIIICKPNYFIAKSFQVFRSRFVVFFLIWFKMGFAINFDQQLSLCTIKINNESFDWMLSSELKASLPIP